MTKLSYEPLYCETRGCRNTCYVGSPFCRRHTPADMVPGIQCYTPGCEDKIHPGSSRYCLSCAAARFGCRFCGSLDLHPSISQWRRRRPGRASTKKLYCAKPECVCLNTLDVSSSVASLYDGIAERIHAMTHSATEASNKQRGLEAWRYFHDLSALHYSLGVQARAELLSLIDSHNESEEPWSAGLPLRQSKWRIATNVVGTNINIVRR